MKLYKLFTYSCMSVLLASPIVGFTKNQMNSEQKREFEQRIHDYLMEHPEVIIKSVEVAQQKEMQQQIENSKKVAVAEKDQLISSKSPSFGAENPKQVMVIFFDYQCGHCKNLATSLDEIISKNKDLKIVYKELPIFGKESELIAKASLAANKQGKYHDFHLKLMSYPEKLNEEKILNLAQTMGMNVEQLKKDMATDEVSAELKENFELAKKIGIRGTPATILTGYPEVTLKTLTFIPGAVPMKDLQTKIDTLK